MHKTTKRNLANFKTKLCEIWSRIIINPIPTKQVFEELKYNYANVNQRILVYRYVSHFQNIAEELWNAFSIETGDPEIIFKKWMDHCYISKIPYIIFENGIAKSPKTFEEWQNMLAKNCQSSLKGLSTSMERMRTKNMKIRGIPIQELITSFQETLELIPDKKPETD